MIVSLNEVEMMSLKASRGMGLPWGLAEDTGKAMRWLAAEGLPWLQVLLARLDRGAGLAAPKVGVDGRSIGPDRPERILCPLSTGSLILDMASQWAPADLIILRLADPLLVLPFLAFALRHRNEAATVVWPDTRIMISGGRAVAEESGGLLLNETARVVLMSSPPGVFGRSTARLGIAVDDGDWARLDSFAARTYVPEDEVSRRRGAGAGSNLDDND